MPDARPTIAVRDLVKRYRGARCDALHGVSLTVAADASLCVVGPNGAGKSTILSILATTLAPTSGSVRIAGYDALTEQALVRRRLGVVFQQPSLDLNLTVEANLRMHAILYGLFPWRPTYRLMGQSYRRRIGQIAEVFGLGNDLDRPVRSLSGGTHRRLELARALIHEPRVLIMDEPTAGLDPDMRGTLWEYLARIRRQRRMTIVFTTHLREEGVYADSEYALHAGSEALSGAG